MAERLFIRQVDDEHWQCRVHQDDGSWHEEIYSESPEGLKGLLESWHGARCALISGEHVTARTVPIGSIKKNLIAKLLPFEIEDQLIEPVEDLHFVIGPVVNGQVNLVYVDHGLVRELIELVDVNGSELAHIFADYVPLQLRGNDAIFLLEDEKLIAKFASGIGFSAEINIAPLILESLEQAKHFEAGRFLLVADSVENLSSLRECLPESWDEEELDFDEQLGGYWDFLDPNIQAIPLNIRSGSHGRQFPFERWWGLFKVPASVAAAAFVFAFAVIFFDYLSIKNEGKDIRLKIQEVYLAAVPNGRLGDEENRLRSKLKSEGGGDTASAPTNLLPLISGLNKAIQKQKDIKLSNFRYSGDELELQVNIEVAGLSELGSFREHLTSFGLDTGSPRTTKQGDIYQANMKITEKTE